MQPAGFPAAHSAGADRARHAARLVWPGYALAALIVAFARAAVDRVCSSVGAAQPPAPAGRSG